MVEVLLVARSLYSVVVGYAPTAKIEAPTISDDKIAVHMSAFIVPPFVTKMSAF